MEIIITQWALDSYLDLVSQRAFTREEYLSKIRPDVKLLAKHANDPKFSNSKFWSPANDMNGKVIPDGYKMKWHQIGPGQVQLRLTVGMLDGVCYLCEAYVKKDDKVDKRKMAKFKDYLKMIRQGRYTSRGKLS